MMKEILVARNALLAYLTISALVMSVTRRGASMPTCIAFTAATDRTSFEAAPITMRSGWSQSCSAWPSRRNSGLAAYPMSVPASSPATIRWPVPGKTVLFMAMTRSRGRVDLSHDTAALTW